MKAILLFLVGFSIMQWSYAKEKPNSLSFLKTSGQYMVNEQKDTILLKGVGLGNWLLPEGYMWHFGGNGDRPRKIEKIVEDLTSPEFNAKFWDEFRANYIAEADIKKVKELGFNSVRPALNARVFLTEGDTAIFIEKNFALLDSLITWCGKYNLYVILDMHGAPGGQTGQNIDDSPNNEPELFMNPKFEHRLFRLWMKIVDRYKDSPVVAGYDLLNEPLPENTGAAEKYKHLLEPMYKRLTAEIRKIDKKHMIIVEGYNWANNWSIFGEPFDNNLVYQFHYYCWDRPDNLSDISYFLKERERLNCPVWVGETGEKNQSIYFATTQLFEKNNIGWAFWPWKKIDNPRGLYSINKPEAYDKVIEYSKTGTIFPKEEAKKIFTQLLENMKVENCEFLEDPWNAMMRQIPSRIYAVNYGHDGFTKSYFVKDTSFRATNYRKNEPVKTVLIANDNGKNRTSEQAILLSESEWSRYTVFSLNDFTTSVTVKAKASTPGAKFTFEVNKTPKEFTISDTSWTELKIDKIGFIKGKNTLKATVNKGEILLQYFDVNKK